MAKQVFITEDCYGDNPGRVLMYDHKDRLRNPRNHLLDNIPKERLPVSRRKLEVIQLIANGLSIPQVAKWLWISKWTVKRHLYAAADQMNIPGGQHRTLILVAELYWLGAII